VAKKPSSKKPAAKKPAKPSLDTRIQTDAALRKRVLANPGLRSKLSLGSLQKYAPQQAKARALRIRLDAPITPGSSTTERDLAHEAQAAQTVRYAPQERDLTSQIGRSENVERDTGTFYDQYQQQLQTHAANIAAYNAGAQQALAQTAQGITGIGQQAAVQMQQGANQQAAQQGVAQAGDLSQLANQATAVRQGLMGTFQAQQAATGAASNAQASNFANVVAPTQKLSALAQARGRTQDVRQKLSDLKTEEGAFNQQYRSERKQDEFKNVLAAKTLDVNIASKTADAAANTPAAKAATTSATEEAKMAAKLGLTVHQYRMLGPKGRQAAIKKFNRKSGGGGSGAGDHYGFTDAQWDRMTPEQKRKAYKDWNAAGRAPKAGDEPGTATTNKKQFRDKYGVDLQPTSAHNSARDDAQNAQTAFGQVGKIVADPKDPTKKRRVTTDMVVSALRNEHTSNLWIRVGLEMARGGLTAGTANRIHKAGYSVSQLGLKMRGGARVKTGSRGDAS